MWKIIKCLECGTPQYIKKTQKVRKCPRCDKLLACVKLRAIASAESEQEAIEIVQSLKTPLEIEQRMYDIKRHYTSGPKSSYNNYDLIGNLLSELIYIFPNALPENVIYQRAEQIGFTEQTFIEKIINQLHNEGLVLRNIDPRGRSILKFPSLPIQMGKLFIKRPLQKKQFNKSLNKDNRDKNEKNLQKEDHQFSFEEREG